MDTTTPTVPAMNLTVDAWERLVPILGLALLIGICLLMSTSWRTALKRWQLIAWGLGLQFVFALLVLKTKPGLIFFDYMNRLFTGLINCTYEGAAFVFGPLSVGQGTGQFATVDYVNQVSAGAENPLNLGFVFAFTVLPTIVFFSALTSILYHLGILQVVVKGIAWVMQRTLKTSGAETLSASANIFVGQTEAPLVVRPFIKNMTQSELMTVMTGGFATVAGGVMGAYVMFLQKEIPDIAGHLMAASVMSAPAALLFGKLMVPEMETPETLNTLHIEVEKETVNVVDAATLGTTVGAQLAINVGAMLLAFLALIALVDLMLGGTLGWIFPSMKDQFTLQSILGNVFRPFAWIMGVTDWDQARMVGVLLGEKMVANEFVAYLDMATKMPELTVRNKVIASYALCGFANFGSIGIQVGGLAVLAPERRSDLSKLGFRAMIAGTMASNATACIAAMII